MLEKELTDFIWGTVQNVMYINKCLFHNFPKMI